MGWPWDAGDAAGKEESGGHSILWGPPKSETGGTGHSILFGDPTPAQEAQTNVSNMLFGEPAKPTEQSGSGVTDMLWGSQAQQRESDYAAQQVEAERRARQEAIWGAQREDAAQPGRVAAERARKDAEETSRRASWYKATGTSWDRPKESRKPDAVAERAQEDAGARRSASRRQSAREARAEEEIKAWRERNAQNTRAKQYTQTRRLREGEDPRDPDNAPGVEKSKPFWRRK